MIKKSETPIIDIVGYEVIGTAYMNMWGGGRGSIPMNAVRLPLEDISEDVVIKTINDGGFGCESIYKADVVVREVWEAVRDGRVVEFKILNYRKTYKLEGKK